jgi:tetratricopeptide (TPR) repeat protein
MMLKHYLIFFFILLASPSISQTVEQLVKQADLLEKQLKEAEAYAKFKEVLKQNPNHLHSLVKCSELASRLGKIQTNLSKQMDYYNAAKIYADRAIRVNPNDSDANMIMSVAYGRLALLKSGKEKVAFVREIKTYADRSIALNPNNFKALHVLGKWHYEVTNLNIVEKAGLKVFFGGLPKATFDSSLYYYKRAAALNPSFALNYLEMGKVYLKLRNKAKAMECFRKSLSLPDATSEDAIVKQEARALLKEGE